MKDNLTIYNTVRNPPQEALKTIRGGRLSGYTDINPMWRIKALTEQFGVCGVGWKYIITNQWIEEGGNGEKCAFTNIDLFIKVNDAWSHAIPGTGGSSFIANEKNGLYTSDECFKMSLTDAISVACKSLGFAADIYWNSDRSKYDRPEPPKAEPPKTIDDTKAQKKPEPRKNPKHEKIDDAKADVVYDLLGKAKADVKEFLNFYKVSKVEDMTIEAWEHATKILQGRITKGEG